MSAETFILFLLLALIVVSLPFWAHSKSWGYKPTAVLTILLIIFLIWCNTQERPLFHKTIRQEPIKQDMRSLGHEIRSTSHDVWNSIRNSFR